MTLPAAKPPAVSAEAPDWTREAVGAWEWAPPRALLASIRAYQRHAAQRGAWSVLARRWAVLRHRFWSVVCGADLPLNTRIAGGLLMPHPNGIVVHPDAQIGPNCLLMQQVTLGVGPKPGLPVLEGHCDVSAGAKVLGGIRLGAHCVVGANAVVLDDVPAGATAVGVPARIVARRAAA